MRARPLVWSLLLGVGASRRREPSFYATCKWQLSLHQTKAQREILKDVRRTMQYHPLFRSRQGLGLLCNVLSVLSFLRASIGYCQSLNVLCATLLLFLSEENAFWALDAILEALPRDYYSPSMVDSKADVQILGVLLTQRMPRLARHLQDLEVDLTGVCVSWFLCLFVDVLPWETTLRVWDLFFLHRHPSVLLSVSLAVLQSLAPALIEMDSAGDALLHLMHAPYALLDADALIEAAVGGTCWVTAEETDKWRARLRPRIEQEYLESVQFIQGANNK
jgi:hypothetical protein